MRRTHQAIRTPRESALYAMAACMLIFALGMAVPVPLAVPLIAIAIGILPFALRFMVEQPIYLCVGFVVFSFFRIHEVFPVLMPFRIPQLLAIPTLAVLFWHIVGTLRLRPFMTAELKAFLVFFMLVTLGLPFATDRPTAISYWTATYVKIGVMTFAIAWLIREEKDFMTFMRLIVLAGVSVAIVAISNKLQGIGLVEGTRVTIGRDIRSVLGDPNDLSLVLLFPLSFAVGMAIRSRGNFDRIWSGIATGLIIWAIIATQSRGGLLGILAVFGVIGWRLVKNKWLLIGAGAAAGIVLLAVAGINERASGGAHEDGIDESAMGRLYAWEAAMLNGVGLDNFVANYFFYSDHWDGMNHAVHSTWFGVLAETGFPGIIAFLTMIVVTVRSLLHALRLIENDSAPMAVRASALGLISGVAGFFASATFLTQGFTWPIYVLVALSASLSRYAKRNAETQNATTASGELR
jgi:putative inorganic carbon (hco3(-)) transporter